MRDEKGNLGLSSYSNSWRGSALLLPFLWLSCASFLLTLHTNKLLLLFNLLPSGSWDNDNDDDAGDDVATKVKVKSHSVMSDFLWPHGLYNPWDFPGQKTGGGKPVPSPGDLPNPGIEPRSPALQVDSLPAELPGLIIFNQALQISKWQHYYKLRSLGVKRIFSRLQSWVKSTRLISTKINDNTSILVQIINDLYSWWERAA